MTLHSPSTISQEQCFKIGHDRLLPNLYELRIRYFDDALYEPEQRRLHSARLRAGLSGVQMPARERDFFIFQNNQTACGEHPVSHSVSPGVPARRKSG